MGSIAWDVYRIGHENCYSDELARQLWIDAGALAVDLFFLALPGITGGGAGFRLALAGANVSIDIANTVYIGARGVQKVYKAGQIGGQIGSTITYVKSVEDHTESQYNSKGRPKSNQAQNTQFKGAIQEIERQLGNKLSKTQIQQLHWSLHDLENPGYWDIVEEGLRMFGGK